MSCLVLDYCQKLDSLMKAREGGAVPPPVDDLITDELTEIWNQLSVDEVREVEARYPALKLETI